MRTEEPKNSDLILQAMANPGTLELKLGIWQGNHRLETAARIRDR